MSSRISIGRLNRTLIGLSLLGAAILTALGFALTPFEGDLTGGDYFKSLVDYPAQASAAAMVLHTGYLLLAPAAIGMFVLLGARARVLGTLGVVLAVIGCINLSTAVFTDCFDQALAQSLPTVQAHAIDDQLAGNPWLVVGIVAPSIIASFLGLILLSFALWRTRLVGLWMPLITAVGAAGLLVFGKEAHLATSLAAALLFVGPIGYLGARVLDVGAWSAGHNAASHGVTTAEAISNA